MATTEEQRAARDAKLDVLHEGLTTAVERLVSGNGWKRALEFAARFRSRSAGRTGVFQPRECSVAGSGLAVGGVVGPLAFRGGGVAVDRCDLEAENAGEHRGWDLSGELFGCGDTVTAGLDADGAPADGGAHGKGTVMDTATLLKQTTGMCLPEATQVFAAAGCRCSRAYPAGDAR